MEKLPAGRISSTSTRRRLVARGVRHIRVAHRVVHHKVIQGNVALGRDLLGCYPMQRLEQHHFFHAHRLDAAQHQLLSFGGNRTACFMPNSSNVPVSNMSGEAASAP